MTSQPMTHEILHRNAPFTLCEIDSSSFAYLKIKLINEYGNTILWDVTSDWEVLTPNELFSWSKSDNSSLEKILSETTLTSLSGYTNFFNSTLIFDHHIIVRALTTDDFWGDSNWGVEYQDDSTKYISAEFTVTENNIKYMPLPYTTSPENPYDHIQTPQEPALVNLIGQKITHATAALPLTYTNEKDAFNNTELTYELTIQFENNSYLRISNTWSISTPVIVIAYKGGHRQEAIQRLNRNLQTLIGHRLIGFGGSPDLFDATIFLDSGMRIDQLRTFTEIAENTEGLGWSVTGPAGEFVRKPLAL